MDFVISLSTIPPRMPHLAPVLQSLLAQQSPAREVVLWLPRRYRRFPDWDGALPDLPRGVRVARCDEDWGPATKILPALAEYRGAGAEILFCDDDSLYPPHWAAAFAAARAGHPGAIIAGQGQHHADIRPEMRPAARRPRMEGWTRASLSAHLAALPPPLPPAPPVIRRSGYADQFLGRAGALVRADFFTDEVFAIPPLLWGHDDLWLSGQAEAGEVGIWCDARIPNPASVRCLRLIRPLLHDRIDGRDRDTMQAEGVAHLRATLGIWMVEPPGGEVVPL
jgi:hypothetical protein